MCDTFDSVTGAWEFGTSDKTSYPMQVYYLVIKGQVLGDPATSLEIDFRLNV